MNTRTETLHFQNADRLSMSARPYSHVALLGRLEERKRYVHLPKHGTATGSEMLRAIHDLSGLPAPDSKLLSLWDQLERPGEHGFATGALQLRAAPGQGVEAKAYLKPHRIPGAGLRPAAMVLSKAVDQICPGAGAKARKEILRRDAIDEIFYVAVSLRPGLEIETYHDVEFRRGDYLEGDVWDIASGLAQHEEIARRARACVRLASTSPLRCNHVSCDLWPEKEGGATVVFSPRDEPGARREDHLSFIQALSDLPGCATPRPSSIDDITLDPELRPSVVAVKIAPTRSGVSHTVAVEEVDPAFAHML